MRMNRIEHNYLIRSVSPFLRGSRLIPERKSCQPGTYISTGKTVEQLPLLQLLNGTATSRLESSRLGYIC